MSTYLVVSYLTPRTHFNVSYSSLASLFYQKHIFTLFCLKITLETLALPRHYITNCIIYCIHFHSILLKNHPLDLSLATSPYHQLYHCITKRYFHSILPKNTLGTLSPAHHTVSPPVSLYHQTHFHSILLKNHPRDPGRATSHCITTCIIVL